jgi:thioredoxin-dependent peroxiredoxin
MIEITFKKTPTQVNGPLPPQGSQAADFELVDQELNTVTLDSLGSKRKLLNVFISLDTSVCAKSIQEFHDKVSKAGELAVLNISMDLPFAAARFCKQGNLEGVKTLSAFKSTFPDNYGIRIMDGPLSGLCARAVFVLDKDNSILYSELVPEITQEPDYDAAIDALKD